MMGIYKFTNKITGEAYIGQSVHLKERFHQHRRNHIRQNSSTYNTLFHQKLREYGFNNFTYEVLYQAEKCSQEELNQQERYWIEYYDPYYNGYNMNIGGGITGANCYLTKDVVIEIKEMLKNNPEISLTEIAKKYNIASISNVSQINSGITYNFIGDYIYPIRTKDKMVRQYQGEKNGRAIFSDEEVVEIRKKFVDYDLNTLYEEYKNQISFSALKKIVYGVHYQHLPCYKKRQKKWFLNGSCIDYPCDEE